MDDMFIKLVKFVVMILFIFLFLCIFKDLFESWLVGFVFFVIKWFCYWCGVLLIGDIVLRIRVILCGMWMFIFCLRRYWGLCVKVLCLWLFEYSYLIYIMVEIWY